jgi:hypothetical protein
MDQKGSKMIRAQLLAYVTGTVDPNPEDQNYLESAHS